MVSLSLALYLQIRFKNKTSFSINMENSPPHSHSCWFFFSFKQQINNQLQSSHFSGELLIVFSTYSHRGLMLGSVISFLLLRIAFLSGEREIVYRVHTEGWDSSLVYLTSDMTFKILILKVCLLVYQNSMSLMLLTACNPGTNAFYAIRFGGLNFHFFSLWKHWSCQRPWRRPLCFSAIYMCQDRTEKGQHIKSKIKL